MITVYSDAWFEVFEDLLPFIEIRGVVKILTERKLCYGV